MNQNGEGIFLSGKFPQQSNAKIKEGIFVGPQINEVLKDQTFKQIFTGKEKAASELLKVLFIDFCVQKVGKYVGIVVNNIMKILWISFPDNYDAMSDKHCKGFHQDIATIEWRCRVGGMYLCWQNTVGQSSEMHGAGVQIARHWIHKSELI